ncbi:hypothetical protein FKM82_015078 [Ascaphus truei]
MLNLSFPFVFSSSLVLTFFYLSLSHWYPSYRSITGTHLLFISPSVTGTHLIAPSLVLTFLLFSWIDINCILEGVTNAFLQTLKMNLQYPSSTTAGLCRPPSCCYYPFRGATSFRPVLQHRG